ncbi:MAG: DUF6754 domain-containing protein [Chloroflexota bacterium]
MSALTGFGVVLLAVFLLLAMTFIRRKSPPVFREIAAFTRLRRAAGLAVEDGTRLHVSLGRGGLQSARGASALAGLALLRRLAEQASGSDRPPVVTSGDAVLAYLSQDTLESAYKTAGAVELFRAETGRLSGLTAFSYAAGAIPVVRDENVSASVLIGHFGPEAALLTESAERENAFILAAADEPATQSILFASVQDPLIGEELYAAAAYAGAETSHAASLQVQDILRWLVVLALLAGAAMKLAGLL